MQDRAPTYPGRVQLTPVPGQANKYDMVRADEPTQEGDAINKANLLPDAVATALGLTGNPQVKDALAKLSGAALRKSGKLLSEIAVGSEFYLKENGALVPYIKLKTNYEGSGRTLVLRKECIIAGAFGTNSAYAGSAVDTYLNNTFLNTIDESTKGEISEVSIPYTIGNGNYTVSTISRKVFLLSATEVGGVGSYYNVEGTAIGYFSGAAQRTLAVKWWLRSPMITQADSLVVNLIGSIGNESCTASHWYRPALTLPETFISPTQNSLTDMLGNDFPLPYAKIEVGSYTGTGTFGSSNKNSLTLDFPPKRISIINSTGIVFGELVIKDSTVYGYSYSGAYVALTGSINGNTISWYAADAAKQLNASGVNYLFVTEG